MSRCTTTVEMIVNNMCEDRTKPIDERIESARPQIFNFNYPVPDTILGEPFKEYFETAFINKYLFEEIGLETVGRWQQRIHAKLLEIMPKYKVLFSILEQVDIDKILADKDYQEKDDYTKTNNLRSETQTQSGSKGASSSLPENMLNTAQIGNFTKTSYADSGSVSRANSEAAGESEGKEVNDGIKTITGRTISQLEIYGQLGPDFSTYFSQFLNEFQTLFMSLFY